MKVAQVSLLHEQVTPCPSGNAARAMLYLSEELVRQGHEVTLLANESSEALAHPAGRFDIVHFHCDELDFRLQGPEQVPSVATLHAPCALPSSYPISEIVLVPTSRRQLSTAASWRMPIPQGLPGDVYRFHEARGAYAVFTGGLQRESGLESAVIAATRQGLPLKVVADVHQQDRSYFLETFRPLLHSSADVQWVHDLDDDRRNDLVGGAAALLASDDRSGAFALNVAEALACGTPVIAWSDTTAADIVQDGSTGFVVETLEQAAQALSRVAELDRQACRRAFEQHFDVQMTAARYLELYRSMNHGYESAAVTVGGCLRSHARLATNVVGTKS